MKNLIHYLKRGRDHHPKEKWGVFAALGVLTLFIWGASTLWTSSAPYTSYTIHVQGVSVPDVALVTSPVANRVDLAAISLVDKRTNQPATGVWVGLRVLEAEKRSPEFTYHEWYSPASERAFYPTDAQGVVYFPLQSGLPGKVEYDIFVANPDSPASQKYQELHESFEVEYR